MPRKKSENRRAVFDALMKFESVKRWLNTETIKAATTRDGYLYHLKIALDYLKVTPDELVNQRKEDNAQKDFLASQRLEGLIRQLKAELDKEAKTKGFMTVAVLNSFLKATTNSGLNIKNAQPEAEHEPFVYEGPPDREQDFWRKIVDHAANIRDAALILIGLEAGPRDSSVLAMTVADVAGEFSSGSPPYKIVIPPPGASSTKKRGGFGFIAEDARQRIEAYLTLRRSRGFPAEPLDPFVVDLENGKRIVGINILNDALKHAFLDSGALSRDQIYPPDTRMSPVRWYALRKRVQTVMEDNRDRTGIALNWVDVLLSHKPRGAQAGHYSRPTVPLLREAYAAAMHRLMIYTPPKPRATKEDIKKAMMEIWEEMYADKLDRRFEKVEKMVMTGGQIAALLRELVTVSKDVEAK